MARCLRARLRIPLFFYMSRCIRQLLCVRLGPLQNPNTKLVLNPWCRHFPLYPRTFAFFNSVRIRRQGKRRLTDTVALTQ